MFKVPPGKLQQLSTNNIALTINKRRTKKVELRDYIAINIALCISLLEFHFTLWLSRFLHWPNLIFSEGLIVYNPNLKKYLITHLNSLNFM